MDFKKILSWIPGWLGFLLLIVVGLLMAIHGLANPLGVAMTPANVVGFSVFGIVAVLIGTFSWIAGGTAEIKGRVGKVGVKVAIQDLPWWAHLVNGILLGIAIILFFVLK